MRTFLSIILLITIVSCSQNETKKEDNKSIIDLSDGNYRDIISKDGTTLKIDYYANNKLRMTDIYKNGNLFDRLLLDTLGHVTSHDPIIIWENSHNKITDTLILKIKNVDSLTYYQYFLTPTEIEFDLEGDKKYYSMKPVDSRKVPNIKISRTTLRGQNRLFIKWGYLVSIKDSANSEIHHWTKTDQVLEFR